MVKKCNGRGRIQSDKEYGAGVLSPLVVGGGAAEDDGDVVAAHALAISRSESQTATKLTQLERRVSQRGGKVAMGLLDADAMQAHRRGEGGGGGR